MSAPLLPIVPIIFPLPPTSHFTTTPADHSPLSQLPIMHFVPAGVYFNLRCFIVVLLFSFNVQFSFPQPLPDAYQPVKHSSSDAGTHYYYFILFFIVFVCKDILVGDFFFLFLSIAVLDQTWWARVWEIVGSNPWSSQTNDLSNWFLSLPRQAISIIRIGQGLVGSISW